MKTSLDEYLKNNFVGRQIFVYKYKDCKNKFVYDTILSHLGDSKYYDEDDFISKEIGLIDDVYITCHAQLQLILLINGVKEYIHIETSVEIEFV